MMELPAEFQHVKQNPIVDDGCLLFIPSKTVSQQVYLPSFGCFYGLIFSPGCKQKFIQARGSCRIFLQYHLQGSLFGG
jgi:hypothetical protein